MVLQPPEAIAGAWELLHRTARRRGGRGLDVGRFGVFRDVCAVLTDDDFIEAEPIRSLKCEIECAQNVPSQSLD
jgi:hypothetical protein